MKNTSPMKEYISKAEELEEKESDYAYIGAKNSCVSEGRFLAPANGVGVEKEIVLKSSSELASQVNRDKQKEDSSW